MWCVILLRRQSTCKMQLLCAPVDRASFEGIKIAHELPCPVSESGIERDYISDPSSVRGKWVRHYLWGPSGGFMIKKNADSACLGCLRPLPNRIISPPYKIQGYCKVMPTGADMFWYAENRWKPHISDEGEKFWGSRNNAGFVQLVSWSLIFCLSLLVFPSTRVHNILLKR